MYLEGKKIVVTGGTGSMGKAFVRRVLTGELGTPEKNCGDVSGRGQTALYALGL
jgi:nucleoside-diphosphate-sugar epimerase